MSSTHTNTQSATSSRSRQWLKALFVVASLALVGVGCSSGSEDDLEPIELTFWGVFDGRDVYEPLISKYEALNPNVNISYSKLTIENYEQDVIEALAAGRGPDVWLLQNAWLPRHYDKLAPAPPSLISDATIRNTFVDAVYDDFVLLVPEEEGGQVPYVYGVPLYMDTLALYYNKDLLQSAGIVNPPTTWTDFSQDVRTLTDKDDFGVVTRPGAAIGTAENVENSVDVLSLLMLQNGTQMVDLSSRTATFHLPVQNTAGQSTNPGLDALTYYTSFSNPRSSTYTWDPTKQNSVDAFVSEEVAFLFHYSYINNTIRARAPQLNYNVAPVPQIEEARTATTFANSWGHVVSQASSNTNQAEAWKFIAFLAEQEQAATYAELSQRPSSHKAVLEAQLQEARFSPFAQQALTAKSWFRQDVALINNLFSDMITSVVLGTSPKDAIETTSDQVTAVMRN